MQKKGDLVIYDKLGYDKFNGKLNSDGVFSSYNFNQAMEFKSQGVTSQAQFSSYKISFTTQHTDSYEVNLDKGPKNQQFSGISANIYSYQNGHWNMFSRLYGEQRALSPAGVVKQANEVVSGWGDATRAMGQIKKDYLNNAQINVLRNKILNNITDHDAVSNIIKEGNSLNDAMKKLGNSIGQYDSDGSFADHKEDTTKASDRYKYANPDKKAAYDNATEVTKALINKDTGTYANQATVEKLTEAENKAWNELNVVLANKITPTVPATKEPVANTSSLTETEKDKVKKNVEEANKGNFPDGTVVTVGADGTATVTYPDGSKDTIPGDQLVQGQKGDTTDAGNITPTIPGDKVTVKDPSHLTDDEKNQVKNNVDNANKGSFPAGTVITVGDDGTTTVTYPDGSKDVIAGTDLVIAAKSEDVPGSKHHSHKNGSNSSQVDGVKGASTANGSIANAGNNLGVKGESDNAFVGVKGESDNAIGNNKATSLKTLPQTGTKDTSILGVLGMLLASLGLFGFKKKRDKE